MIWFELIQIKNVACDDLFVFVSKFKQISSKFNIEMTSDLTDFTILYIAKNELDVDIKFAKEFMTLYDQDQDFVVDVENLVKWEVDKRKDHAKQRLLKNFKDGEDFVVKKIGSERMGAAHNTESIMMTVDCFKDMCMLANNEMGKKVKRYYRSIEKIHLEYVKKQINQSSKENALAHPQTNNSQQKSSADMHNKIQSAYHNNVFIRILATKQWKW